MNQQPDNNPQSPLRDSLIVTFAALLIFILRMLYFDGGSIHPEAYSFLRVYTEGRPFWETIFNPAFNDWIMYQPRELSYIFDYVDARLIAASIHAGWVHFYSLSCILLGAGTVFLQQFGARKCFPKLDPRIITLVSLIYALLPTTSLTYYRSSKPLTAFFLTASCFLLLRLFHALHENGRAVSLQLLLFISLFFLMMSDRQGTFFVAAFATLCGFVLMFSWKNAYIRNRSLLLRTAFFSWGIVFFGMLYNIIISPSLVYHLNGYIPDFEYQHTASGDAFRFAGGLEFVFSNIGRFFSASSSWLGILFGLLVLFFLSLSLFRRVRIRRFHILYDFRLSGILLFFYSGTALLICSNVMAVKCPPILATGALVSGSYSTPLHAFLVFFLFLGMNATSCDRILRKIWTFLLCVTLLLNLLEYCSFSGRVPRVLEYTYELSYGRERQIMRHLLLNPEEDYRIYPLMYHNMLLLRQMRGLPAFEDESRVYYYYHLYRGVRI